MILVRGSNGTALISMRRPRNADVVAWRVLNSNVSGQIRRDTEAHFQSDFVAMVQAVVAITGAPQILTDIASLN